MNNLIEQSLLKKTKFIDLVENNIFGEISSIYGCQTTAAVVGRSYALLGILSKANFKLLTADFPDLENAFKERISKYTYPHKRRFLEVMKQTEPFQGLNDDIMMQLLYSMEVKDYLPGQELIALDCFSDQMFFVQKGEVAVEVGLEDGHLCIEKLRNRTILNMHNIFLPTFRSSSSYVCRSKCEVMMITNEKLMSLCRQNPKLMKQVVQF